LGSTRTRNASASLSTVSAVASAGPCAPMSGTAVAALRFWADDGAATRTVPEGEARGALVAWGEAGRAGAGAVAVAVGGVMVAPLVGFSAVLRFLRRGVVGSVSGFATAEAAGAGAGLLRDGFVVFTFCGRFLGAGAFALGVSFSAASFDVLVLVDTRADRLRVVVDMLQRVN
jgi:hypothetical protein